MTTIAEKRLSALAVFANAESGKDTWESAARALAAVMPAPKQRPADPDGPEWCEYTAAEHKGRGKLFRSNCSALFEFADGRCVHVPLRHRNSKDLPDWSRATRFAVRFYRLTIAARILELTGGAWGSLGLSREERLANICRVPEIVGAMDESRGVSPDIESANASTAELRDGEYDFWGSDLESDPVAIKVAIWGENPEIIINVAA